MCVIIFLHFFIFFIFIYLFVCCSFVTFVSVLARGKTTLPHLTLSLQTEGKTFLLKGRHYTHYKSKTIFCRTFLFFFFLFSYRTTTTLSALSAVYKFSRFFQIYAFIPRIRFMLFLFLFFFLLCYVYNNWSKGIFNSIKFSLLYTQTFQIFLLRKILSHFSYHIHIFRKHFILSFN